MPDPKTFYNVMSEAQLDKKPSRIVMSETTKSPTDLEHPNLKSITMPKKPRKKLIILLSSVGGVILIALVITGLLWYQSHKRTEQQTNNTPGNNTQNQTPADPDVTTPADWLARFFGSDTCTVKTQCGDSADPDRDGFSNKEEYDAGTDPNNPDSDNDGVADGDEVHIFKSDPLISRTFREGQYLDADFIKGGYSIATNTPYTDEQLTEIKAKIKELGLHQPTLTTLGEIALSMYDFKDPNNTGVSNLNIDQSPQAKLDRDTQRQSTIKKIGSALLKYKESKKTFPLGNDFVLMSDAIGPYNTVATNYNDPISKEQYVYGYEASASGGDFTLTYFSETQNQLIKYTAKNAQDTEIKEKSQEANDQRKTDLENIRNALIIYSTMNVSSNGTEQYVFPTQDQYPNILVEDHLITTIPKDPSGAPYMYEVSGTFNSFTLKAVYDNPPAGVTGYMCNQDECRNY